MATTTKTTPTSEQDRGPFVPADTELAALKHAAQALRASESGTPKLIAANGDEVELPPTLLRVLRLSAETLANDEAVLVVSLGKQISPHQAAELLSVPITHLVKLLDDGELPFTLIGEFRRLSLNDVLAYRQVLSARQDEALDEMTRMGQEWGLNDIDYSSVKVRGLAEIEDDS